MPLTKFCCMKNSNVIADSFQIPQSPGGFDDFRKGIAPKITHSLRASLSLLDNRITCSSSFSTVRFMCPNLSNASPIPAYSFWYRSNSVFSEIERFQIFRSHPKTAESLDWNSQFLKKKRIERGWQQKEAFKEHNRRSVLVNVASFVRMILFSRNVD